MTDNFGKYFATYYAGRKKSEQHVIIGQHQKMDKCIYMLMRFAKGK